MKPYYKVLTKPVQGIRCRSVPRRPKLITNSAYDIQGEIEINRQKLSTVSSFKYLGAVVSVDGSKPETSLKDCTRHGSSYKAEAHLER